MRRFVDEWQAEASLALRRGDVTAASAYAAHHRLETVHPALVADRVARQFDRLVSRGGTVAITTASARTARAINVEIQRRRKPCHRGVSAALADGTFAYVGDRVATRRNAALTTNRGTAVRNRQIWDVFGVGADGSLLVEDPTRGSARLPSDYVRRYVELGWAVTGYGTQGATTDHAIAVVEPASTRAGIYVAMTRGRDRNVAWIVDATGLADPEDAPVPPMPSAHTPWPLALVARRPRPGRRTRSGWRAGSSSWPPTGLRRRAFPADGREIRMAGRA